MTSLPIRSAAAPPPMNPEQAANIEAWTEQASEALKSVSFPLDGNTAQPARGTSLRLSIPLDESQHHSAARTVADGPAPSRTSNSSGRRGEPIRRDSLKRREALLKGKEGSRQRRRWENGRSVPSGVNRPLTPFAPQTDS